MSTLKHTQPKEPAALKKERASIVVIKKPSTFALLAVAALMQMGKASKAVMDSPKEVLKKCLSAEFESLPNARVDLTVYSAERQNKFNLEHPHKKPEQIEFFSPTSDPIFIVSSYNILRIEKLEDDKAKAFVQYNRIAKSKGRGFPKFSSQKRILIPDCSLKEQVSIDLIRTQAGWRILDPPSPRVGHANILLYYKDKVDRSKHVMDLPSASKEQKENIQHLIDQYSLLIHLGEDETCRDANR